MSDTAFEQLRCASRAAAFERAQYLIDRGLWPRAYVIEELGDTGLGTGWFYVENMEPEEGAQVVLRLP